MKKRRLKKHQNYWWVIGASTLLFVGVAAIMFFIFFSKIGNAFDRLDIIEKYAHTLEEYPMIDNQNWFNPDYSLYYKSQVRSWWKKILIRLGIVDKPEWSLSIFKKNIDAVIAQQEEKKMVDMCACAIVPKDSDRFFLWTDLQGSFHSLVRCLKYLKDHEIVDNALKLQEDCYLLFNGNVFDYGPTILQTVTLLLRLMIVNPERVMYVANSREQPGGWYEAKVAKELHMWGKTNANEAVPLAKEMDHFLAALPNVLYLIQQEKNGYNAIEVVFGSENENQYIRDCDHAMMMKHGGDTEIVSYKKEEELNGLPLNVRAVITAPENVRRLLSHPDGLIPVGINDKEQFAWITFSSPNGRSHQIYQFFYDTVIELCTRGPIDAWTITEYRNDVRDHIGFEFGGSYHLTSGLRPGDEARVAKLQNEIERVKRELEKASARCEQEQKRQ